MVVLFRLMMMVVGYVLACLAASLVLIIGTLTPDWNEFAGAVGMQSPAAQSATLWMLVGLGAAIIFAIAMLPALLVIALAEGFAVRSVVLYGVIGGALALAMAFGLGSFGFAVPTYVDTAGADIAREREVIAAAGIAGGLVYWLFAGRKAGAWN